VKVEKKDGSLERSVLIGMITSSTVLRSLSQHWPTKGEGLFSSSWSNLLAKWSVDYFNKYGKAPNKRIETMFLKWQESNTADKDTQKLLSSFLSGLSKEYSQAGKINADYLIDTAAEYFNRVRINRLQEMLLADLDSGDLAKAESRIATYSRIEMGDSGFVDLATDQTAMEDAFLHQSESLIDYSGAAANFFNDELCRDGFIAIIAPEKRGKTFFLMDMAWRGARQGRKVAFFQVGDLSRRQIQRRFAVRAAKRPLKQTEPDKPVKFPMYINASGETVSVDHVEHAFDKPLPWKAAMKAMSKLIPVDPNTGFGNLRVSVHPNSSISIKGIEDIVRRWSKDGWVADIVVIDYADILAPLPGYQETRDQVNATWKYMRGISQAQHCLVITATQANAASYKADILDRSNFSEDKRKLAHVTGMLAINQNKEEKLQGATRLNWVVLREGEFSESQCLYCAGCLAIANPIMLSSF
jgi:hypothetical protein